MEIRFLRQPYRFIKKANQDLKEKIKQEVLHIKENPKAGKMLKGKLKGLRSHPFNFNATAYRIAYKLVDNILIIAISTRENYYRDLIS